MPEEDVKIVTLTKEQFDLVSQLIERVSAAERAFDEESEQLLKRVAEIFDAEYNEDANLGGVFPNNNEG